MSSWLSETSLFACVDLTAFHGYERVEKGRNDLTACLRIGAWLAGGKQWMREATNELMEVKKWHLSL